tara:strand:+ start:2642 stop:2908 length:267 start_codon:yes stop_codon:yes gene_type:complete
MALFSKAEAEANFYYLLRHNEVLRIDPIARLSIHEIKEAISNGDAHYAKQIWSELDRDVQVALWVAPTKGGILTTFERKTLENTSKID